MKAIILAAGRGSRLNNLTDKKPKCLLEINGQTMFDRQLEILKEFSTINNIAVITGYLSELLARSGLQSFHNANWKETNMVCSLLGADEWLSGDTCVVTYSDIIYEKHAISKIMQSKADVAILYDREWELLWKERFDDPLCDAESFQISNRNHVIDIGQRVQSISSIKGQYMGILKFSPQGWHKFKSTCFRKHPAELAQADITSILKDMIINGNEIEAVRYRGRWAEVDSERDLMIARRIF